MNLFRTAESSLVDLDNLLDLDEFCAWLKDAMSLHSTPDPSQSLTQDLGLDDFGYYVLVTKLDRLIGRDGKLQEEVYIDVESVRDLHLYYLQVMQEPMAQ